MLTRLKEALEFYGAIVFYVATMAFSIWLIAFAPDYPLNENRFDWIESR